MSSTTPAGASAGADTLLDVVSAGVDVIDLGRQLRTGMPQSPNHPQFWHTLPRRHGDMTRADGGSAANDMITTGTHVGTHIDALAHVSHNGKMYGGIDAVEAGIGGKYDQLGVHTIAPMMRRGVLLDIPALLEVEHCAGGYEITVADLEGACARQGVEVRAGDVVLVRSGWGSLFEDGTAYLGKESGVPGVSEAGAQWLAEHEVHAVGADTIAFERLAPSGGHALLPAHRVLLVEHGIYIIESMDLEALAAAGRHEFTFVLVPMNIYGATGSPVRPLAVVPA
ncbi:Kynurenine formamidase [Nocardioides dokdonensis FR1436]|uniref:Kynurenine formamidase n=1 Tax=Nocardioides dokdonensis FR1436 TaxID=1300347 RepID=A0A1A9GJS1_9ACTN|nr:cyclase family protein [Nocardioides dokdonensis]ANH38539.1 Kynurenine formamidase [Nocardioides dokdonensis FR1436]